MHKVRLLLALLLLYSGTAAAILQFLDFVEVSPFADGDNWFLTEGLEYDVLDSGLKVSVPRGFVTDFASVPRPFWVFLPKWGKYGPPAVIHDYLYAVQSCTREQSDRLMLLAMSESDVGRFQRAIIYRALRLGGNFSWRANGKRRTAGFTRVIPSEEFPSEPNVTWETLRNVLKEKGVPPYEEPNTEYCAQADELFEQRYESS